METRMVLPEEFDATRYIAAIRQLYGSEKQAPEHIKKDIELYQELVDVLEGRAYEGLGTIVIVDREIQAKQKEIQRNKKAAEAAKEAEKLRERAKKAAELLAKTRTDRLESKIKLEKRGIEIP